MSLGLATTSCVCTTCGWTSRRSPRHMSKPCPECHNRTVIIPEGDERKGAFVEGVAIAAVMLVTGVVVFAVGR